MGFQPVYRISATNTKLWVISLVCWSYCNMLFYLSDIDKIFKKCSTFNNNVFFAFVSIWVPEIEFWNDR